MSSMFKTFETDEDLENDGVWVDYGDFRVKIAHAGQGNKKYVSYAEKALKPVRKAIQAGALGNDRSRSIMIDIYAKTVIRGWQTRRDEKWVDGIEQKDSDELLPVNVENVDGTLRLLPNLFVDLQEQATSISNFRAEEFEEDSGNS